MEDSDYLKLLTWLKINLCWFNVSLPRYDWSLYLTKTPLGRNSMLRFRNCHSVNVAWRFPKSLVQNAPKYSCPFWKVNRRRFRLASLGYVKFSSENSKGAPCSRSLDHKISNVIPIRIYSNLPPKWSKILCGILEKEAKPSVFGDYQNEESSNTESASNTAPVMSRNGSEPKKQSNYKSVHDKNLPSWLLDSITHEVMRQASVYSWRLYLDKRTWKSEYMASNVTFHPCTYAYL